METGQQGVKGYRTIESPDLALVPQSNTVISALPSNFPGFARGTIAQAPGRDPNEIGEMSDDAEEQRGLLVGQSAEVEQQ